MHGRDIQRVLHGVSIVTEGLIRYQAPRTARLLERVVFHVQELASRTPDALSTIQNAQTTPDFMNQLEELASISNHDEALPIHENDISNSYEITPQSIPQITEPLETTLPTSTIPQSFTRTDNVTENMDVARSNVERSERDDAFTNAIHDLAEKHATLKTQTLDTSSIPNSAQQQSRSHQQGVHVHQQSQSHQQGVRAHQQSQAHQQGIHAQQQSQSHQQGIHAQQTSNSDNASQLEQTQTRKQFRERKVPSSPFARAFGFGSMAAGLAVGSASSWLRQATGLQGSDNGNTQSGGIFLNEANAERLAAGLCRMRGAALKLGQMLSLQDENTLPAPIATALERVRSQADIMPRKQLESVLKSELGENWRSNFKTFSDVPIAAASIGQVHKATLLDGREVAVKIQYPGVAESIDSDLNNLERLLKIGDFLPKGLYLENIIQAAREELKLECDYVHEAKCQQTFYDFIQHDPAFEVPEVIHDVSSQRVLTTTWLHGYPIDQVVSLPQNVRNTIARRLLRLTLRELFEFRFMQTDPNWGNFFYNPTSGKIGLLDFGASRSYSKSFMDDYLELVWAAAQRDRTKLLEQSLKLGFLTGLESPVMTEAHIDAGMVVGEPFATEEPFDFKHSGITKRVGQHGEVLVHHRLTPPPAEIYSLHRKLSGAFLICIRIGAVIPCRDLLLKLYEEYQWGSDLATSSTLTQDDKDVETLQQSNYSASHDENTLDRKYSSIAN